MAMVFFYNTWHLIVFDFPNHLTETTSLASDSENREPALRKTYL